MSEQEKAYIFNRFQQTGLGLQTPQEYGESGFGLTISQRLIQLLGGTIECESQKGKGTKFTCTIKCKNVSKPKELPKSILFSSAYQESLPRTVSRRILIAEDNVINQKLLKKMLEDKGHVCTVAPNGEEAVRLWEQNKFDIILMDIEMPNMNGLEATKIIRQKEKAKQTDLPIVIIGLSGYARGEKVTEAKNLGMDDYLIKPYDKDVLTAKISLLTVSRGTGEKPKRFS